MMDPTKALAEVLDDLCGGDLTNEDAATCAIVLLAKRGFVIAEVPAHPPDAQRIIACVNALAGIPDPAALMEAVAAERDALTAEVERLKRRHSEREIEIAEAAMKIAAERDRYKAALERITDLDGAGPSAEAIAREAEPAELDENQDRAGEASDGWVGVGLSTTPSAYIAALEKKVDNE